jgi:catechol 2,3-dioxygenase-like lactoylglutathione lyase family enzyme
MQASLSFLTLGVSDLERARTFYCDQLGWSLSPKSVAGVVAFFQLNGFVLALYPRAELARDAGVPLGAGHGVALSHNVAERREVDRLLAELSARGVTITRPAADTRWGGRNGYFADPDGYLWEVAWNPGPYLGADGSFCFDRSGSAA